MNQVVVKTRWVECRWASFERAGCSRTIEADQKAVILTEDPPPTDPDVPATRMFCSTECAEACVEYWKKEGLLEG